MLKKLLMALTFYIVLLFAVQAEEGPVLKIEASNTDYLLGEPVVLYVSLQNTSDEVVELPFFLAPMAGFVSYHIKQLVPEGVNFRTNFGCLHI